MINLNEAFRAMELLESEDFPLNSDASLDDLDNFLDDEKKIDFDDLDMDVYDFKADELKDLKSSYQGQVVCACNICKSLSYQDPQQMVVDPETGLVNVGEECPICLSTDGCTIIGQIAPYQEEPQIEITPKEEDPVGEEPEDELGSEEQPEELEDNKEEKEVKESLKEAQGGNAWDKISRYLNLKNESIEQPIEEAHSSMSAWDKIQQHLHLQDESIEQPMDEAKHSRGNAWDKVSKYLNSGKALKSAIKSGKLESCKEALKDCYKEIDEKLYESCKEGIDSVEDSDSFNGELDNFFDYCDDNDICVWDDEEASLEESLNDVQLDTDHEHISIHSEEKEDAGLETIEPIQPDMVDQIVSEQPVEEEPGEEIPMEEPMMDEEEPQEETLESFDEHSFNKLAESYLNNVYNNVKSFKTTSINYTTDEKMMVEGIIKFNTGASKKTTFVFEGFQKVKNKYRMLGENMQITPNNRKAFSLRGVIKDGSFICETLKYRYDGNLGLVKNKK